MSDKKEAIKLEHFLSSQVKPQLLGTVEAVLGDDSSVKVTPSFPGEGCGCASAIELPKNIIDSVTETGETHVCCGKHLKIVEIHFVEGATLGIADFLNKLQKTSHPHFQNKFSEDILEASTQFFPEQQIVRPTLASQPCQSGWRYCPADKWNLASCCPPYTYCYTDPLSHIRGCRNF